MCQNVWDLQAKTAPSRYYDREKHLFLEIILFKSLIISYENTIYI